MIKKTKKRPKKKKEEYTGKKMGIFSRTKEEKKVVLEPKEKMNSEDHPDRKRF